MSNDARGRLRRLLAVLPILAERGEIAHRELRRLTGIAPAQLLDDLGALAERDGDPGGFVESIGITLGADRIAVRTPHFRRPVRLNVPELCALELGLAMLRASRPPDEWPPIDRARGSVRKLIARLAAREPSLAIHATPPAGSDSPLLATLRRAQVERRHARVWYRSASSDDIAERTIAPLALVPWHGIWYVCARARDTNALRFYRLDRVEHVELLDDPFTVPDDFDVSLLLDHGRPFRASDAPVMRVRYSSRIAPWIAEREGVLRAPDGTVTLEHPVADVEWAIRHVLQYGPEAEVLEPDRLRREIANRLRRALQ